MICHSTIIDSVIICISFIQFSLKSLKDTNDTHKSDSFIDLHLEINNGWRFKQNSTANMMTFPIVNFPIPHSNIPVAPAYEVIFWTELSSWRKNTKAWLDWCNRYKNYTTVIANRLIDLKYQFVKWQWIFYHLRMSFSILYYRQDIHWIWLCETWRVSYKTQQLLTIPEFLVSSLVYCWIRVAHLCSFLCCVVWFVCLRSGSGVQCWQYLWIVHSWLSLRVSLTFI
jgi:hypothetical protein